MTARNSLFSRSAHLEPVERTPVWFMRQAGRILPEYRAIRKDWTLVEICKQPELCTEVTMQPIHHLDVDAAILFADIMTPLIGVGIDLEIVDSIGPVISEPVRTEDDLKRLRVMDPQADVPYVFETIRLVKKELGSARPLIGFAGAPFTLASYLVEGKPSRDFRLTKRMMYSEPELWHSLMRRLTDMTIVYLQAQAEAGADTLQLFDSWIGALSGVDYARYVQPYTQEIFAAVKKSGVPMIHFGSNTAMLLEYFRNDGADIIGVDWRMPLDRAWDIIGHDLGIQGNLDPVVLSSTPAVIRSEIEKILKLAAGRPGHIFNLGHGMHPLTPVENVVLAVQYVKEIGLEINKSLLSGSLNE